MTSRALLLSLALSAEALAQPLPRSVRQDLPVSPALRAAYANGTRDSTGLPGRRYWQQRVDYRIEATLDPSTSVLHGRETITLHNNSPDSLERIVLRLYQNLFQARVRRTSTITDITDGMIVERVAVNGAQLALAAPDYTVEERIATLKPVTPIAPGSRAMIEVDWRFTVPAVDSGVRAQRTGRWENYLYQIAQWYPQVAMYDDLRGWDTDQYVGNAEFYNPFGSFGVRITVPAGWLVGATGDLRNPNEVLSRRTRDRLALAMRVDTTVHVVQAHERGSGATGAGTTSGAASPGSRLTWHFSAPRVNDFAFAVSRDYVWDATHATIPGKGRIPVHVLYLPTDTAYRVNNTARYGRQSIEQLSRLLFPYEFSQGTIADGPETGMEYPMIIFSGSGLGVTIHEFAHQWFPMTVASNETRHGFMDESFANYVGAYVSAAISGGPVNLQSRGPGYRAIAGSDLEAPVMWPTLAAGPNANVATYGKAVLALNALGGFVGDSAVLRAFARYANEWKFRHPTPWDFFFSLNRHLGRNLDWFWHGWFFTSYTFDQALESVRAEGDMAVITVRDKGDLAMPLILGITYADSTRDLVTIPADPWLAGQRSFTLRWPLRGRSLQAVRIDPDNRFQDMEPGDNGWTAGVRTN